MRPKWRVQGGVLGLAGFLSSSTPAYPPVLLPKCLVDPDDPDRRELQNDQNNQGNQGGDQSSQDDPGEDGEGVTHYPSSFIECHSSKDDKVQSHSRGSPPLKINPIPYKTHVLFTLVSV
jgi:hypothetical protein